MALLAGCASKYPPCPTTVEFKQLVNQQKLLSDIKTLSSREMQGRKPQSIGSIKAASFIRRSFVNSNLKTINKNYDHPFTFGLADNKHGVNLIGLKPGTNKKDQYIVITAHYDHIGKVGRKVFYGADDNASGVSAMIAIADFLKDKPTEHSILFVATDAEENGLFGAKEFVKNPPVEFEKIKYNINIDMVSQGGAGKRLYIAGTRKNPQFKPLAETLIRTAGVCLRPGHEGRQKLKGSMLTRMSWNYASDHAPFNKKGVPFLYFGVDLHRHYHQPSDKFENIDPEFFIAAVETIIEAVESVDRLAPESIKKPID